MLRDGKKKFETEGWNKWSCNSMEVVATLTWPGLNCLSEDGRTLNSRIWWSPVIVLCLPCMARTGALQTSHTWVEYMGYSSCSLTAATHIITSASSKNIAAASLHWNHFNDVLNKKDGESRGKAVPNPVAGCRIPSCQKSRIQPQCCFNVAVTEGLTAQYLYILKTGLWEMNTSCAVYSDAGWRSLCIQIRWPLQPCTIITTT